MSRHSSSLSKHISSTGMEHLKMCPHTPDHFPHNMVEEARRQANHHRLMTSGAEENLCLIYRWLVEIGVPEAKARHYIQTSQIDPIRDAHIHRDRSKNLLLAVLKATNQEPTPEMKKEFERDVTVDVDYQLDFETLTKSTPEQIIALLDAASDISRNQSQR
ncbi:hypothetical protein K435DRAFT_787077 [Dendrothele bispora CBS 962.96]|uniref:Uncharacterized protein n=1 Tax=Dendrothele bispora (strain CBS 962.96) TaxID=1314807 RepID=A0A4S8KMC3_DENBC|nr:hypothetical protein K435DRAFT_787077 [Dendrothele bispora CBS 962.96]